MKHLPFITLLMILSFINGQTFAQTLQLRAGKTAFPGDYFAARIISSSSTLLQWGGGLFSESSGKLGISYQVFGAESIITYPVNTSEYRETFLILKPGFGFTAQYEREPFVYAGTDLSKRLNYGLIAELSAECYLSDQFSFSGFFQQKYLLNKLLGSNHFLFGLGLSIHFNQ